MAVPISQMFTVASYVLAQKLKGVKRYPLVLMLEPLFRCNLACAGCGKIQYPDHVLDKRLTPEQCCYIGDDLTDLPVIRQVGLGIAVADAAPEVCAVAAHITKLPGGHGAVRESLEMILKAKGRWEELMQPYFT